MKLSQYMLLTTLSSFITLSSSFLVPAKGLSSPTFLKANLASQLILKDLEDNDFENKNKAKTKLSRPERKALERAKKAQQRQGTNQGRRKNTNRRKHDYAARADVLKGRPASSQGQYELHSSAISQLSKNSTADDVLKAIKRAQNLHDVHDVRTIKAFLMEEVGVDFAYGYRGALLARLAVAALHLNKQDLAYQVIQERRLSHRPGMRPMESAAIIRGLLRVHNVSYAFEVLDDELSLPLEGLPLNTEESQDRIKHRALSLGSIASRHFFEGEPALAVRSCKLLAEIGPVVREAGLTAEDVGMPWARIIRGAAQCESGRRDGSIVPSNDAEFHDVTLPCNMVYAVLDAMTTFPSENDDRTYEMLSNALIRRVLFVTGAVDMTGCPPADRGEAAFIGRSNVGKSSLVNMVTNRKSLAYTSKTPGKTQQFNYFTVNDKPGREKEIKFGDHIPGEKDSDSFYLVDLPGFGFANVPDFQRKKWSEFMATYLEKRKTLKVLFHLVDSRIGPTSEDERIMQEIGEVLPKRVSYVVVLTKADKQVKGQKKKNTGKVDPEIMQTLRKTMKANKLGRAPVILSSSETKLGRDDLWRYLRLAAEA